MMKDRMFEAFSMDKKAMDLQLTDGSFKSSLDRYANGVSADYIKHGSDMNQAISKIASRDNLNKDQIQRIVEEANNRVYLAKYALLKNSNDRDVLFDKADLEKISSMDDEDSMNKIASSIDEPRTSYNSTRNITGSITPTVPATLEKMIAEKLASDLSTTSSSLADAHIAFDSHIYKVAEMLIRYDRAGIDTDTAFEEICRTNGLNVPVQEIIKRAASELIDMEKSANSINDNYELNLPFVDLGDAPKDYSLGEFSKIASMNFEDKKSKLFPVIQVHGTLIKTLPDMVKFASELISLYSDIYEKDQIFKDVEKKASFSFFKKKKAVINTDTGDKSKVVNPYVYKSDPDHMFRSDLEVMGGGNDHNVNGGHLDKKIRSVYELANKNGHLTKSGKGALDQDYAHNDLPYQNIYRQDFSDGDYFDRLKGMNPNKVGE